MVENNILFLNLEVKMERSLLFSRSFDNKKFIFIRINLITFGHRPTRYFQTACVESRLNLARIASKC